MTKTKTLVIIICLVSLAGVIFLSARYYQEKKQVKKMEDLLRNYQKNDNILVFTNLFIEKVLQSDDEIDFETRLQLENSVRDLNNKKIYSAWQKFVDSKDEAEAQKNVEDLLSLLVKEIMKK